MTQIYELWPKVALEVGAIHKEQRNTQQSYSFRGIDDVMKALHRPLFENGLVLTSETLEWECRDYTRETQKGTQPFYQVFCLRRYTVTAPDGSSISADALGASIDYQDKAANQAMSQALKMAMLQLLVSPTDDVDPDALTPHAEPGLKERAAQASKATEVLKVDWEVEAKKSAVELCDGDVSAAAILFGNALTETGLETVTTKAQHAKLVKAMAALLEAENG